MKPTKTPKFADGGKFPTAFTVVWPRATARATFYAAFSPTFLGGGKRAVSLALCHTLTDLRGGKLGPGCGHRTRVKHMTVGGN
jgi:hypothetical protein